MIVRPQEETIKDRTAWGTSRAVINQRPYGLEIRHCTAVEYSQKLELRTALEELGRIFLTIVRQMWKGISRTACYA